MGRESTAGKQRICVFERKWRFWFCQEHVCLRVCFRACTSARFPSRACGLGRCLGAGPPRRPEPRASPEVNSSPSPNARASTLGSVLRTPFENSGGDVVDLPAAARLDGPPCVEPQIRRDHPLNLSISISGGKETNEDSLSNGERSGNSSSLKSPAESVGELWPGEATGRWADAVEVDLEGRVREGESPVRGTVDQGRHCLRRVGLFGNAAQSGW